MLKKNIIRLIFIFLILTNFFLNNNSYSSNRVIDTIKIKIPEFKYDNETGFYFKVRIMEKYANSPTLYLELFKQTSKPDWIDNSKLLDTISIEGEKYTESYLFSDNTIQDGELKKYCIQSLILDSERDSSLFYYVCEEKDFKEKDVEDTIIKIEEIDCTQNFVFRLFSLKDRVRIAQSGFYKLTPLNYWDKIEQLYYLNFEKLLTLFIVIVMIFGFSALKFQYLLWSGNTKGFSFLICIFIFFTFNLIAVFLLFKIYVPIYIYLLIIISNLIFILLSISPKHKNCIFKLNIRIAQLRRDITKNNLRKSDPKRMIVSKLLRFYHKNTVDIEYKRDTFQTIQYYLPKRKNLIFNDFDILDWFQTGTQLFPMIGFGGTVLGLIINFGNNLHINSNDPLSGLDIALFTTFYGIILGVLTIIIENSIEKQIELEETNIIKWLHEKK